MSEELKWETVVQTDNEMTQRLRIPEGWLYRSSVSYIALKGDGSEDTNLIMSMVFVPTTRTTL
jgi:hypothetical protein